MSAVFRNHGTAETGIRWARWFFVAALTLGMMQAVTAATPQQEPRHALVIGNANYATAPLVNSTNEASAVAKVLAKNTVAAPPGPGSIAVQAFVNQGDEAYRAMAKGLAAMIIADLSKVPGLKVLEREKVQLLVNEAKLGDSGLADKDSAVRSGRLMRAEKVVVGNFEVQQ